MLNIAINPLNSIVGDFSGNAAMIVARMRAAYNKADLLVFPELALCGYYPFDLLCEPDFLEKANEALDCLLTASLNYPDLMVVIGTIRENHGTGKPLYNALVIFKNGAIITEYHKQLLPTYNVFDERRHFEPGNGAPCCVQIKDDTSSFSQKIGFIICEDGWYGIGDAYAVDPLSIVARMGPDLIISINASPSNIGKREQRHQMMADASKKISAPILYVNAVGGQDDLVFDGAAFAMQAGHLVFEAESFNDAQQIIEFERAGYPESDDEAFKSSLPAPTILSNNALFFQQIVLGLRDYARKCGFKHVVVGCSGGIDSALTLALAVEALGAHNVKAITMPSDFSSEGSVSDSERLCDNLGIKLINHPIKELVSQYSEGFGAAFREPLEGVVLENLQARIRGTILMEYSNNFDALLLSTGNKSEISIGYCTLYGDTNGGLNLIGDLYKTEVYGLSAYINERAGRSLIPSDIITKEPSAELAPGQRDTDSLPPYELLDDILKFLIEGRQLSSDEYQAVNLRVDALKITHPSLTEKIKTMIFRNEYKRFQAPPIIRVRSRAFGRGRQMPIAANHENKGI